MNTTQQDHELAEKVVALLNQGTQQIDAGTAAKLLEARKQALAHFNEQPERSWAFEWAAQGASRIAEPFSYNLRAWVVLLALLTSLAGAVAWQSFSTQGSDIADIDEGLLTSELPINAYLDRSFDSWLKRPSH
ncbi:MAG: DUF3619 family protein [Burkholderiales bacterium]